MSQSSGANNQQFGSDDLTEKTSIVTGETFNGLMRPADEAPPALVVLLGPQGYVGKQYALVQAEYVLGRSVDCGIHLDDKSVSRNHARLVIVGSEVTVVDLGSANKTVVNGNVLNPMAPMKLKNNDQIKIGNLILKFLEKGNLEAITNREMNEKAVKDGLTGAYTKGALIERGPELIKRSEVLNEELSLIVLDIDHFKKINDQYGHAAGDVVLKQLSDVISTKVVRSQDFFARYGGEEFVILLAHTPLRAAAEVSERIRATVESTAFMSEGKRIPVTVSVGVATRKSDEDVWDTFFKRADTALYQSKQNGRNRVTISQ
ncbi:MAG: GGDEF domain-containing protein [Bdellovibrionaceae bacterium]|nr:GGDEF domain-containing protein [Pseudobdellovibrionaceae bacterium]